VMCGDRPGAADCLELFCGATGVAAAVYGGSGRVV